MEFGYQECYLSEKHNFIVLFPPFPYFIASNLGRIDANFSVEILTPSAVLDHRVVCASSLPPPSPPLVLRLIWNLRVENSYKIDKCLQFFSGNDVIVTQDHRRCKLEF